MQKYIIIFLFTYALNADSIFEDFLSSQNGDLNIKSIKLQQELISKNEFSKNYVEKIRLNLGYSRFDKSNIDDEYEVRIYPKTPSQMATQKRLYNLNKDKLNLQYQESKELTLKSRYLLLLDTYFQKKIYKNIQKMLELDKKKLNLSVKTTNTVSDIYNLSKLKYKIKDIEFSLLEQKEHYKNLLEEIGSYISLIDIKDLDKAIENISFIEIDETVEHKNGVKTSTKKELIRLQMLKEEIKLNKISNSLRLRSLDLGYEDRGKIDKSLSIGLSIEYAWPKRDSLQNLENNLELIATQNEILKTKNREDKKILVLKKEIVSLKKRLLHLKKSTKEDKFFHTYRKLKAQNPLVILELKKRKLEIEETKIEVEHRLYSKFIDVLFATNTLTKDALFKKYKKREK